MAAMSDPRHILVVEDEPDLAELARLHLEDAGYDVSLCHDGAEAVGVLEAEPFDLVVLDLMLPGLDGLEVCRHIRKLPAYTPVLILTAKGTELDRVVGLELGADDYMTKPASPRELVARVRAIFRMRDSLLARDGDAAASDEQLTRGSLVIDPGRHVVRLGGATLDLTLKEFELLHFFARSPGRVFRRDELVEGIWGLGYEGYEHTVNSHINRLRKKLGAHGAEGCIETVWGVGYKFREGGA